MRHFLLVGTLLLYGTVARGEDPVPPDASKVVPLPMGARIPSVIVRNADGSAHPLSASTLVRPTILIFYRGGWCPYCNRHLGALKQVEPQLLAMGYDLLFLSADRPELLYSSLKEPDVHYTLLSDAKMDAGRAYHVAFHLDDKALAEYRGYGVDVEAASGEKHHELPVPAVFIIDRAGVIRFVHANPDFTSRISPEELVGAARAVAGGG